MAILVTGSDGLLGSTFKKYCESDFVFSTRNSFDITNLEQIKEFLVNNNITDIIHCIAMTNVELCETEQELAKEVNYISTVNLLEVLKEINPLKGGKFVYISSTGNYGNHKANPYTEKDILEPTTVHHQTKLASEKYLESYENSLIIRTGWLFGGDKAQVKNFVYKRFLEAKDKEFVYGDPSQFGNPTYVDDLVKQILLLIKKNSTGVFNCVNSGTTSRLGYVQEVIRLFGGECKVVPAPKGHFKRVAPVSQNEMAINEKLNELQLNIMQDWKVALKSYILELKKDLNDE